MALDCFHIHWKIINNVAILIPLLYIIGILMLTRYRISEASIFNKVAVDTPKGSLNMYSTAMKKYSKTRCPIKYTIRITKWSVKECVRHCRGKRGYCIGFVIRHHDDYSTCGLTGTSILMPNTTCYISTAVPPFTYYEKEVSYA